jgi:amidophosphoribosyltransferase
MCGIYGMVGEGNIARQVSLGLYDLQHRGEQAAGIATSDGEEIHIHKDGGLVTEVFENDEILKGLPGRFGIGHVLYSTVGKSGEAKQTRTFQPLIGDFHGKPFVLAHNGNLINLDS